MKYISVIFKHMLRRLLKSLFCAVTYPLFTLIVFLVAYSELNVKFGLVRSSRLGHSTADIDAAFTDISTMYHKSNSTIIVLVTEKVTCNNYVIKLIQRINLDQCKIIIVNSFLVREFVSFLRSQTRYSNLYFVTSNLVEKYSKLITAPRLFNPSLLEVKNFEKWVVEETKLDPSKPSIFLHNRDNSYLPHLKYHSFRDFPPEVFVPIIDGFIGEFNFFRGGIKASENLLSTSTNFVDLPFLNHQEEIGILAQHNSIFYFGSDSGIHSVNTVFRKPISIINYSPCNLRLMRQLNHCALGFILKKLVNKASGEPIGLIEMFENKWVDLWQQEQYDLAGVELISNTREDTFQYFEDVVDIFNSDFDKSSILTPEQEEFWRIVTFYQPETFKNHLILDNCYIGPRFLNRNSYLIE